MDRRWWEEEGADDDNKDRLEQQAIVTSTERKWQRQKAVKNLEIIKKNLVCPRISEKLPKNT